MEVEQLFCYKGRDIFIAKKGEEFQIGVGSSKIIIWLKKAVYKDIDIATSSGVEYAKIFIDCLIVDNRKGGYSYAK